MKATPPGGAAELTVDVCGACSGFWLDGSELAIASLALGGLPYRLSEIAQHATPGEFACPRCRSLILTFDLLDVAVDLCRECQGLWLDGGEFQRLATAGQEPAERPKIPESVSCKGCSRIVALAESYYSDRGLVCAGCQQTTDAPAAIDARSGDARRAYADFAARQGAIMAENQRADGRTSEERLEKEIRELRNDVWWLRHRAR
jgi:Zn-finger nucleic acid-binding protein